jgi:hypothetical protein
MPLASKLSLYRRASSGTTDVLFVSHLHVDHINGIDRLQAMAPARTVVVPYLDTVERLLFVLSDFEQGTTSRTSLDYFEDPVAWWLTRGVVRVIFLQQAGPDDTPPLRIADPDGPIDEPPVRRRIRPEDAPFKEVQASRLATHLSAPHGPPVEGLTSASPTSREGERGASIAASGSYLQLGVGELFAYRLAQGDWILLPYVYPVVDITRKRFLADLKMALGVPGNDGIKLKKAPTKALRTLASAKTLVDLYSRHFAGGHNVISMSLYSGPLAKRHFPSSGRDVSSRHWRSSLEEPAFGRHFWQQDGFGWLSTGDAALRHDIWRLPWQAFFSDFGDQIAVMTLPHHGSANNSHSDILALSGLRFALAATVEARNRVARLRETLGAVESRGIRTRVVDAERLARFTVVSERSVA